MVLSRAPIELSRRREEDPTGEDDIAIGGNGEGAHIAVMAVHGGIQGADDALVGGLSVIVFNWIVR